MKTWTLDDVFRLSLHEKRDELNRLELAKSNAETLLRERLKLVEELANALEQARVFIPKNNKANAWLYISSGQLLDKRRECHANSDKPDDRQELRESVSNEEGHEPNKPVALIRSLWQEGVNPSLSTPLPTPEPVTALAPYGAHQSVGNSNVPTETITSTEQEGYRGTERSPSVSREGNSTDIPEKENPPLEANFSHENNHLCILADDREIN